MPFLIEFWKPIAALIAVLGIVFGVWYYGHARYETGYRTGSAVVIAADRKVAAAARAAATAQEAAWTAQLKGATDGYKKEIDRLRLQPVRIGSVRLCKYAAFRGSSVSGSSTASGRAPGVTAAGGVQSLPRTDHRVRPVAGPDIGRMLAAFAASADETLAKARLAAGAWPR